MAASQVQQLPLMTTMPVKILQQRAPITKAQRLLMADRVLQLDLKNQLQQQRHLQLRQQKHQLLLQHQNKRKISQLHKSVA